MRGSARCSATRAEEGLGELADRPRMPSLALLADPAELALLREMASFPRVLEGAAIHYEPHRVAFYLQDLAGAFHALWTRGKEEPNLRFLIADAPELTAGAPGDAGGRAPRDRHGPRPDGRAPGRGNALSGAGGA